MVSLITIAFFALPPLPSHGGTAMIPAQEWEFAPGPREINVYVYYPHGDITLVGPRTGLMLCLHNWGGTGSDGAPDPVQVADRYNVIAISVDYLQSGDWDANKGIPYDFGYLQALDALRALRYVFQSLDDAKIPFARGRIYATGGSGGANVALMANKLAPRTFACVVAISGMAKLSDDIAYGLPGGSDLNAGYSQDINAKAYLTPQAQEIRDVGNPKHLSTMRHQDYRKNPTIILIHGADDTVCPTEDVRSMAKEFESAGVEVTLKIIAKKDIDGDVITGTGHALGDRTRILFKFADNYLLPKSRAMRIRKGSTDFEFRDRGIHYSVTTGTYVIEPHGDGFIVGTFYPLYTPIE